MHLRFMAAHIVAITLGLGASTAAATTSTWSIPTDNMVCMGGAIHAEMAVSEIPGVEWVTADPYQGIITATIADEETTVDELLDALEASGVEVGAPARVRN